MSKPKLILLGAIFLFTSIGMISLLKKNKSIETTTPTEITENLIEKVPIPEKKVSRDKLVNDLIEKESPEPIHLDKKEVGDLPGIDLVEKLFATDSSKLPIVETITYTSRVPWLKGRPAWIADYASHYATSRHFIARSLNRKLDYFTQNVSPGDRFNVIRSDLNLSFYLLVDTSKCKMWFYCIDLEKNERVLLKTYNIGVGRKDSKKVSGCLTPFGKYLLGSKIAIYKEGIMGYFQDQKVEMLQVFGTRWIPFEKEIEGCSDTAKGYGIHGSPWHKDPTTGELVEDRSHIRKFDSDGCIRLNSEDIEELFAIIITKPTTVEIVDDLKKTALPGKERESFSTSYLN